MSGLHLLPIGKIRKAHGIRGEVSVDYYADSPALLSEGVYLRSGSGAPVPYAIQSFRTHHGSLLVRFISIDDKNAADALRGHEMLVPEDRLPAPSDGAIYLHEIMGLRVLADKGDGTFDDVGVISAIADTAGQELWTIAAPGETDVLFPAAPEFVLGFDLVNRTVRIAPPPGLIDLYRS